jgi:hypothetical protein
MTTKYTGHSFDFEASSMQVTGAVIRKDRISVDWIEEGAPGHLEATSEDGEVYRGTYGYPRPDPYYHAELRLYRAADGGRLLFGRWWWADESGSGYWLFRLSPESR